MEKKSGHKCTTYVVCSNCIRIDDRSVKSKRGEGVVEWNYGLTICYFLLHRKEEDPFYFHKNEFMSNGYAL